MMLNKIVHHKKAEVARSKIDAVLELRSLLQEAEKRQKLHLLKTITNGGFREALTEPGISLIAEVKRASPSRGLLKKDLDPAKTALAYEKAGAAAVSVLTDSKFFQGSLKDLEEVKAAIKLPVLRKDFIIDAYQIYEAKYFKADAVLLIAAILEQTQLRDFIELAHELALDALVEVHSREDLDNALECGAKIIGVNNRDLTNFSTDISTTLNLADYVPNSCILTSESGISTGDDVKRLAAVGVDAILVGEALVTSPDIDYKIKELLGR